MVVILVIRLESNKLLQQGLIKDSVVYDVRYIVTLEFTGYNGYVQYFDIVNNIQINFRYDQTQEKISYNISKIPY